MKTYYEILGVSEKATTKEIKSAYKALMKKYHPDVYKGNDKIAAEINNAYDVLSNAKARQEYDQELKSEREVEINRGYSYYNYSSQKSNKITTNTTSSSSYRKESAQDIYNRITKNRNYKKDNYSNSYSYRAIYNTQNYVQKKLSNLSLFQLMLIGLIITSICIIGISLSLIDLRTNSKNRKSQNTVKHSTTSQTAETYYYPPYDKNEDTTTDSSSSIRNLMESYGFNLYFDNVQDFYTFMLDEDNRDLYIQVMTNEITQDQYLQELYKRAEEKYK